jgi:Flp pilus assembly protein TadB
VKALATLLGLLLLAAAAAASLSPLLAIAAAWLALIVAFMAGVNWYRGRLERRARRREPMVEQIVGWLE